MTSQEKTEKQLENMEILIKRSFQHRRKQSISKEYTNQLHQEMQIEELDEKSMRSIQNLHANLNPPLFESRSLKLKDKVQQNEKRLEELRDEIDNLIIKAIGDTEVMKIEQPEKERKIKAYYESESAKALQEMDALNIKFSTIEQEIRNQISAEAVTRRTKLNNIKDNLQRQLMEKSNEYFNEQNKCNELWKKLETLKAQAEKNTKTASNRNNVMVFESTHLNREHPSNALDNMEQAYISKRTNATGDIPKNGFPKEMDVSSTDTNIELKPVDILNNAYLQFERDFFNNPTLKWQHFNPQKIKTENALPSKSDNVPKPLQEPKVPASENLEISDDLLDNSEMNQASGPCRKLPKIFRGKGKSKSYYI